MASLHSGCENLFRRQDCLSPPEPLLSAAFISRSDKQRQTAPMRLLSVILLSLAIWAAPAYAESKHGTARDAVAAGEIRPLGEVLARVAQRYPGQALDVRLDNGGGSWLYHVKVLGAGGDVVVVTVDARTGRIVGARGPRR
jgi:uncharacterized membrane protein YkoI